MATKATVRAWRGVWLGWVAFLVLAAVAYLTPLRLPVLKLAGRDHAVIRLQAAAPGAPERPGLAARRAAWARDHARLSLFGFVRWADDLWPWLVGLGFALPVLGGLVGAQAGGRVREAATPRTASVPVPSAAPPPAPDIPGPAPAPVPAPPDDPGAARDEATEPTEAPPKATPETSSLPDDPAAWSWNARPAPRAPARPKPPPVISPNGDSL